MDYNPFVNPTEQAVREVMESCGAKAAMSFVGGGVMGGAMGIFLASMDVSMPYSYPGMNIPGQPSWEDRSKMTTGQTLRDMGRTLVTRAWSYSKSFAFIGLIFAGSECMIESHRAKHDHVNTSAAACFTGGILGLRGGPGPAALGCASFVAFSLAIDAFLGGGKSFEPPPKPPADASKPAGDSAQPAAAAVQAS